MRKNSISFYDWCLNNKKNFLLSEWDYENNEISPKEISRASKKKVNWICEECGNCYLMAVQSRTLNGSKCRKCSCKEAHEKERKRRIIENGSLEETNPELLEKWNYDKNLNISPKDVSRYSTIKVWWKCPVCGYEFQSKIADISDFFGCTKCRGNKYVELGKDGKYTVYCHICPDGKRYIGVTSSPLKIRFGNGRNYLKTTRFGKAIERFGWENINHDVLESGLTLEEAYEKEKYYIGLYKTTDEDFGYNMASGGISGAMVGRILSPETREKIGCSNKGKRRNRETIERLKISHLGKESHNIRGVLKIDLNGNVVEEYVSIAEAVRKNIHVDETSIWRSCTGRRKTSGGYIWKYK